MNPKVTSPVQSRDTGRERRQTDGQIDRHVFVHTHTRRKTETESGDRETKRGRENVQKTPGIHSKAFIRTEESNEEICKRSLFACWFAATFVVMFPSKSLRSAGRKDSTQTICRVGSGGEKLLVPQQRRSFPAEEMEKKENNLNKSI